MRFGSSNALALPTAFLAVAVITCGALLVRRITKSADLQTSGRDLHKTAQADRMHAAAERVLHLSVALGFLFLARTVLQITSSVKQLRGDSVVWYLTVDHWMSHVALLLVLAHGMKESEWMRHLAAAGMGRSQALSRTSFHGILHRHEGGETLYHPVPQERPDST